MNQRDLFMASIFACAAVFWIYDIRDRVIFRGINIDVAFPSIYNVFILARCAKFQYVRSVFKITSSCCSCLAI